MKSTLGGLETAKGTVMTEPQWTTCPHCALKHRERPDGQCPRCRQPLSGPASEGFAGSPEGQAAAGALPQVFDGRSLPGSALDREAAAAAEDDSEDSPWTMLAGGVFLIGSAIYLHGAFGELAAGQRQSMEVWWGIAVLYNTLGPTVTVAIVGLLGGFVTWKGLHRLLW